MLYTDAEKALMERAVQPNMRKPGIHTKPFETILAEQLSGVDFSKASILDIGPGHCDFLDLAKKNGAARTVGMDFDPAIVELGKMRNHEMIHVDFREGWPKVEGTFDGIFCRGSFNIYWFDIKEDLPAFLSDLRNSNADSGWMWIAPWNKPGENQIDIVDAYTEMVNGWANREQVQIERPLEIERRKYGINYTIPDVTLWKRGLKE